MKRSVLSGNGLLLCLVVAVFYCSHTAGPVERPPSVTIFGGDTTVALHDSLLVRFSAGTEEPGSVRYLWFVDSPLVVDTTYDNEFVTRFSALDTGGHTIVIRALDARGRESAPESLLVVVTYTRPVVTVTGDSIAYVNTPYVFHCATIPEAARAVRYEWYVDTPGHATVTIDTAPSLSFALADTGNHCIIVRALDEEGVVSLPDTLPVTVTFSRPHLRMTAADSVKANAPFTVRFSGSDSFPGILTYRYYSDSAEGIVTSKDSVVSLVWSAAEAGTHRIVGWAVTTAGIESSPETLSVIVTANRPAVTLSAPADVPVNDTIAIVAHATDSDGAVKNYRWSIDGGFWFTTDTSCILWTFNNSPAVAGSHTISVIALDDDGLFSDTARLVVTVSLKRPAVLLSGPHDTTVYAGVPLAIRAAAMDANGVITAYRWKIDGRISGQDAMSDSISASWGAAEAGVHFVTVTVVDDDSLESPPDTLRVMVLPGMPSVVAMNDTAVSSYDTLIITCQATDPNGSIVGYLWDYAGNGWNDSTATPGYPVSYTGKREVRVRIGVRDNDGLTAIDTVLVTFNRPPDTITLEHPGFLDTMVFNQVSARCTVSFAYDAPDPDSDPVTYTLFWGPSSIDSAVQLYQGPDRAASVTVTRPGHYFWRLVARDPWGHTRASTGKVTVIREYRICFIGHSVIAGWGGNGIEGGFRGGVIDSLRKSLGACERLKVAGPLTTTTMTCSIADDSCLAQGGATAREVYLMLGLDKARPNADIWVLMVGVNDSYSYNEWGYATKIMDDLINRNPASRLYVINGYALPDASYLANNYRPMFNKALQDTAVSRNAKGAHIAVVDAFGALSTTAGLYDATWYADGLHPNQAGYYRLRDRIWSSMKNSDPPALPVNP